VHFIVNETVICVQCLIASVQSTASELSYTVTASCYHIPHAATPVGPQIASPMADSTTNEFQSPLSVTHTPHPSTPALQLQSVSTRRISAGTKFKSL
jgi:hypothetical protein